MKKLLLLLFYLPCMAQGELVDAKYSGNLYRDPYVLYLNKMGTGMFVPDVSKNELTSGFTIGRRNNEGIRIKYGTRLNAEHNEIYGITSVRASGDLVILNDSIEFKRIDNGLPKLKLRVTHVVTDKNLPADSLFGQPVAIETEDRGNVITTNLELIRHLGVFNMYEDYSLLPDSITVCCEYCNQPRAMMPLYRTLVKDKNNNITFISTCGYQSTEYPYVFEYDDRHRLRLVKVTLNHRQNEHPKQYEYYVITWAD